MQELIGSKVVFSTNIDKLEILKSLTENSIFLNLKYYDVMKPFAEFHSSYPIYMKNNHHVPYDLANALKSVFDYIDLETEYKSNKLNDLKNIKEKLVSKGILEEFDYSKFKNAQVVSINNMPIPSLFQAKEIIKYTIDKQSNQSIHMFNSKIQQDSLFAVYEHVVSLIEDKIGINDIIILNTTDNDDYILEKIFNDANIPIQINKAIRINTYPQVIKLLDIIEEDGYEASKEYLLSLQKDANNRDITKALVRLYNSYLDIDLEQNTEFLIYRINQLTVSPVHSVNCVNVYGIDDFIYDESKHYFVLNYTDQSIPKRHPKTAYLSTEEFAEIGYLTDKQLQDFWLEYYTNQLASIKNLSLYFSRKSEEENRVCKLNLQREIIEHDYLYEVRDRSYLNALNQLEFAKTKYNYYKYNLFNENYKSLYQNFHNSVDLYNHDYTGIDQADLDDLLKRHNSLTGAKLDTYQLCKFQFLMTYLLRISPADKNIGLYLGNLSHKILEEIAKNKNIDYHRLIDQFEGFPSDEHYKEKLYKQAIKEEMDKLIPFVLEFHETTNFSVIKPETKFSFEFKANSQFRITGTIDKMMIYESEDGTNYVAFIDYKLSSKDFKLDAFNKNLQFQLPVYLYAYKNINQAVIKPVGIYYQTTTLGRYYNEDNVVSKNFQLYGVSLDDKSLMAKFSPELEHIRGISIKKDGQLSDRSSGRLLNETDFEQICHKVEQAFIKMAANIKNGDFEINPLPSYGSKHDSLSCEYCNYASICYNKNKKLEVEE